MILQPLKTRHSHGKIPTNAVRFVLSTAHLVYRCRYLELPFEALSCCCGSQGRMTGNLVDLTSPVCALVKHRYIRVAIFGGFLIASCVIEFFNRW